MVDGERGHRVEECGGLRGGASGHPQMVSDPDIANEHAVVQQRLPGVRGIDQPAEENEVGVARHGWKALCSKGFHDSVALLLDGLDLGEQA